MSGIILLGAIAVAVFFLAYLAFNLNKEHGILAFLFLIVALVISLLIPKTALDEHNECSIQVSNQTISGNSTSYTYQQYCFPKTTVTAVLLWRVYVAILPLTLLYITIYLVWKMVYKKK